MGKAISYHKHDEEILQKRMRIVQKTVIHTQKYDIVRMVCLTIAMMEEGGRSVKRKVFSALLALCVLISTVSWSALPAQAENNETGGATHKHDYVLSPTRTSIGTGHFYLNEDWLLKGAQTIRVTGDATICLNGHKIDVNGKSLQIIILAGAKLTICDCGNTLREGHLDANGLWHEGEAAAGETDMPIYGGVITGHSNAIQLVSSYGEFYLESGSIAAIR